jgi:hypothetical protein
MISYILQAALTCLFGPLLPFLIWAAHLHSYRPIGSLSPLLRKLQTVLYDINVFFSVSLLLAAVIRYRQLPSILEIIFLSALVNMQTVALVTPILVQLYDNDIHNTPIRPLWAFFQICLIFVQFGTSYSISLPQSAFPTYFEMAKTCHNVHHIQDVSYYFSSEATAKNTVKWYAIGFAIGIGYIFFLFLIVAFQLRFDTIIRRIWVKMTPKWLRKHGMRGIPLLALFVLGYNLIQNVVVLLTVRNPCEKD